MNDDQRSVAQFWARLASIRSLDALREGERLLLLEDFKDKVMLWLDASLRKDPQNYPFKLTFGLDAPLSRALTDLHKDARGIIGDLLDGKTIDAPSEVSRLKWSVKTDGLEEHVDDSPVTLSRLPVPEIYNH